MNSQSPVSRHPRKPSGALPPGSGSSNLWNGLGQAWTAVGYLLCGMVLWGGAGLGLDRVLGTDPILTIVGALTGHVGGIYLVVLRMKPRREGAERRAGGFSREGAERRAGGFSREGAERRAGGFSTKEIDAT